MPRQDNAEGPRWPFAEPPPTFAPSNPRGDIRDRLLRTEVFEHAYGSSPNGRYFLAPLGPADPTTPSRVAWADNWMRGLPDSH